MERTKVKKPDAILTSDWHLREDTPTCFTGDWYSEQWEAVQSIFDLQVKYNCSVLHAGDLFHHWKPSPWLLSKTMFFLPKQFYTIYGQHDLPQHNWELRDKSGIYTLQQAGRLNVLFGCHYGYKPDGENMTEDPMIGLGTDKGILVWHHMTYIQPPYPGATGGNARQILLKYPQYDLIVTGDNHQSFSIGHEGRLLVNPGNITRQNADQIDFQPRVALWYADTNTIQWVNLPIQENAITREHIEKQEERKNRAEAFIQLLDGDWTAGMSFEENLERFKDLNKIRPAVMDIIYKSLEYESH